MALERDGDGTCHGQSEARDSRDANTESGNPFDPEEYGKWIDAMGEYNQLDALDWYRQHPELLAKRVEEEHKQNAFLRTRGIVKMLGVRYTQLAGQLEKEKRLGK